jgi:hypothetical protein
MKSVCVVLKMLSVWLAVGAEVWRVCVDIRGCVLIGQDAMSDESDIEEDFCQRLTRRGK